MSAPAQAKRVTISLNGREVQADEGELLIEVAERNGVYIPRFCYHKRMSSVGMCRMCLVSVEGPRGSALQVSCMLNVSDGMKVETENAAVKKAQDGVLEFLLANHPLDCPVCDKGGECPLQDQTLAFGPGQSRYIEEKRHFEKPIAISDLVTLDRERCILCDRCTRFAKEIAGDPLIHFQARGNETQVNTFPSHPFASYFSGNTVQLCPVGALTATPYRFKNRPWDLSSSESTCMTCSVGCRIAVQTSQDSISRYIGLDSDPVNQGWLCDKGRFAYEALQAEQRLAVPMKRDDQGVCEEISWSSAIADIAKTIQETRSNKVAFLGGSHMPLEDQYVWAKLLRRVIKTDFVDCQLGDGVDGSVIAGLPRATIDDACGAKTIILMAPDLKETAPVLYLRLREAVLRHHVNVIEVSAAPTSFTPLSSARVTYRPGEIASAIAGLIDRGKGVSRDAGGATQTEIQNARAILSMPGEVVTIFGRANLAESAQSVEEAVGLLANYSNSSFLPVVKRGNTIGAIDMGLSHSLLPGRVRIENGARWYSEAWGEIAHGDGGDALAILREASKGNIDVLFLSGADPVIDFPDRELVREALGKIKTIIAIDTHPNDSNAYAHYVLPAAAFGERGGTTSNLEGRISTLAQAVNMHGSTRPDWMIAVELADALGVPFPFENTDDIWCEIESYVPLFSGITKQYLHHATQRDGIVVPLTQSQIDYNSAQLDCRAPERPTLALPTQHEYRVTEVRSQPERKGDEVRLVTGHKLYDGGVVVTYSPHLANLPAAPSMRANPSTITAAGFSDGDTVKMVSARAGVVAQVYADESIARGVVVLPYNLSQPSASEFIDATDVVTTVRLERP